MVKRDGLEKVRQDEEDGYRECYKVVDAPNDDEREKLGCKMMMPPGILHQREEWC